MVPSQYDVFNSQRPQRFVQQMAAARAQSWRVRRLAPVAAAEDLQGQLTARLNTIVEDDAESDAGSEREEEMPRIAMVAC